MSQMVELNVNWFFSLTLIQCEDGFYMLNISDYDNNILIVRFFFVRKYQFLTNFHILLSTLVMTLEKLLLPACNA